MVPVFFPRQFTFLLPDSALLSIDHGGNEVPEVIFIDRRERKLNDEELLAVILKSSSTISKANRDIRELEPPAARIV